MKKQNFFKSVRFNIFVATLIPLVMGTSLLGLAFFLTVTDNNRQTTGNRLNRVAQTIQTHIAERAVAVQILAEAVASLEAVQAMVAAGDHDGLIETLRPMFTTLKAEHAISQMHIHTADVHSLARLHREDKWGDDLSGFRPMLVEVNRTRAPRRGIEAGKFGTPIRGAVPVFHAGRHVGSVEAGSFLTDDFLRLLADDGTDITLYARTDEGFQRQASTRGANDTGDLSAEALAAALVGERTVITVDTSSGARAVGTLVLQDALGAPYGVAEIAINVSRLAAAQRDSLLWTAAILGGVLLLAGMGSVLFANRLARPIMATTDAMGALTEGRDDISIVGEARRDELGQMARALHVFRDALVERRRLEAQKVSMEEVETQKAHALRQMADTVQTSVDEAIAQVRAHTEDMCREADELRASSGRVESNSDTVAVAARQALASAQTVAAATEELTASIDEIARQMQQSAEIAQTAVGKAADTQNVVKTLGQVGDSIGEIVRLIGDIAAQTNLLALNATIEAARAGEAGKGFAVVAAEVKQLATQTAQSTGEIERRVAEIRAVSRQVAESIDAVSGTIEEIDRITGTVAGSVEQQRGATAEIARNVRDSSEATADVSARIEAVSQEATQTNSMADELRAGAEALLGSVQSLGATVTRIVRTSSDETDRRRHQRWSCAVRVKLSNGGKWIDATMLNISRSGSLLEPLAGVRPRDPVTVDIPALGARWGAKVVSVESDGVHLAFDEDHDVDFGRIGR